MIKEKERRESARARYSEYMKVRCPCREEERLFHPVAHFCATLCLTIYDSVIIGAG